MASNKPLRDRLTRDDYAAFTALACIILALVGMLLLTLVGCTHYNPALYPGYDVLNPSDAVRANPLSISEDPITHESIFAVNTAFLQWVDDLKQEVLRLRKGAKSAASESTPQEQ